MADQAQPQGQGQQASGANPQAGQPTPPPQTAAQPAGQQPQAGTQQPPQGVPVPPPGAPVPPPPPPPPPMGMDPSQGGFMPPPGYPPMGYGYPPQGMPPGYGYPPQGMPPGYGYPPQGMPPGYGYPPQGMPPMGYGQPGAGGMPGGEPEDTTPANFQLGTKLPRQLKVKCPPSNLKFDEEKFVKLLAGSISLSKDEKKKIVESVPKLKIEQIEELMRIFEEEKEKFAALSKKHVPQLEKLAEQHFQDWMQLEGEFEQDSKKKQDQQKAEEIRKNLGI